jgi:hypothetical protein
VHCANSVRMDCSSSLAMKSCACTSVTFLAGLIFLPVECKKSVGLNNQMYLRLDSSSGVCESNTEGNEDKQMRRNKECIKGTEVLSIYFKSCGEIENILFINACRLTFSLRN